MDGPPGRAENPIALLPGQLRLTGTSQTEAASAVKPIVPPRITVVRLVASDEDAKRRAIDVADKVTPDSRKDTATFLR